MTRFQEFKNKVPNENCGTMDYTQMAFEYAYNLGCKNSKAEIFTLRVALMKIFLSDKCPNGSDCGCAICIARDALNMSMPEPFPTPEEMIKGAGDLESIAAGIRDAVAGRVTPIEKIDQSLNDKAPKCQTCNGRGRVTCAHCTGNGIIPLPSYMRSLMPNLCDVCRGSGDVVCTDCKKETRRRSLRRCSHEGCSATIATERCPIGCDADNMVCLVNARDGENASQSSSRLAEDLPTISEMSGLCEAGQLPAIAELSQAEPEREWRVDGWNGNLLGCMVDSEQRADDLIAKYPGAYRKQWRTKAGEWQDEVKEGGLDDGK